MNTVNRGYLLITLAGMLGLLSQASGQDTALDANFGSLQLQGDFQPDPYVITISAGGSLSAASLGGGCAGYISDAPDYELYYSDTAGYPLSFFVTGTVDTTLIINDPSGNWSCNDDFSDSSEMGAGLVFEDPQAGTYDIWIGTFNMGDRYTEVQLQITEMNLSPWDAQESGAVRPDERDANREPLLTSSGTGFIVSPNGHVLTNYHVVEGCVSLTFQIRGDVAVDAAVLSVNAATDLALMKTSLARVPAVFRSGTRVRLGDEVVVYGFPLLGDLSSQGNLTNGIVSALSGLQDDLSRLQITAPIQPGNSGGPVMDRAGHVVGIVVETANDEYFRQNRGTAVQNLNFAIHEAIARSFLDTNNVPYKTGDQSSPSLGIADIAEQARGFTGQVLCYQ